MQAVKNSLRRSDIKKLRVISRIDVKNEFAIKGIHLEGLRKIGDPNELAQRYYLDGVDEIIFMDAVASLYDRNNLSEIIKKACHDVFVPITVGGGIRTLLDISKALQSGADKVAINTQAIKDPAFVTAAAYNFGSQCIVGSIESKKTSAGNWEAYVDNGREPTGIDAIEWAIQLEQLGVGELMITSVDKEGTKKGLDIEIVEKICTATNIPVIACGGVGSVDHVSKLCDLINIDAVAAASIFHYDILGVAELKRELKNLMIEVRHA